MNNLLFRKDGTAQGVAKQRLIESIARVDKRVIFDPYAESFVVGAGIIKLLGHSLSVWLTKVFAPGFHEHLIARTRFIDDLVKDCATNDVRQYVMLGAGYDMRAHRLDLPSTIKIFEVDQAEVQKRKLAKIPKNIPNTNNVTYVSVDFNHQSLTERLLAEGFDQSLPTIFTLEGVSQYISKEATAATIKELSRLTEGVRSTLFLSYVDERFDKNPEACFGNGYPKAVKRANMIKQLAAKVGEPWVSYYSAEEIKDLLSECGFSLTENKNLADLNSEYFSPVGRTIPENNIFKLEHFVIAQS